MPTQVKNELEIIPVKYIDEVFEIALEHDLKPISDKDYHLMINVKEGLKKPSQESFSH